MNYFSSEKSTKQLELHYQYVTRLYEMEEWEMIIRNDAATRAMVVSLCRLAAREDEPRTSRVEEDDREYSSTLFTYLTPGMWNSIKAYALQPLRERFGLTAQFWQPHYTTEVFPNVIVHVTRTETYQKYVCRPGTRTYRYHVL